MKKLAAVLVLAAAGCGGAAPEESFRSEEHGLRFRPPTGWSERTPAGTRPARDVVLVSYRRLTAGRPAWLEVSVVEGMTPASLASWLAGRQPAGWRRQGPAEEYSWEGRPAARAAFAGRRGRHDVVSEVAAVRRGGRVYLFTGTFPAGDEDAREEVRQAVGGVSWDAAVATR
jgi:hypothetical protein